VSWHEIESNWRRFQVSAKRRWGKIDEAQLVAVAGRRTLLAGRIRDAYGITLAEAEQQLSDWQLTLGFA